MEHHFDIDHAVEFGIEEAIIIYNFRFWLLQNKANHRNIKKIEIDGEKVERYFTYNSAKALSELFPYLNPKQVYRIMESLEKKQVLVKKYFNQNTYNRTSWYCFKDQDRFLKAGNAIPENDKSNSRKQEMDLPKTGNHDTDNKPDIKPDNKHTVLPLPTQLKEFAKQNNLVYEINVDEDRKIQSKLVSQLSITNEQIVKQIERLKPILKDSNCDWWSKTNSFGFNFLLKNWGRIDSWHNANKPQVREFKKPEKQAPAKFSNNDLDSLKEFLA
jgi:hypothetical protein